jgi:quinol monooxygenase YgiN
MQDYCALVLRFKVKDGCMERMLALLQDMMDRCAQESTFVTAIRHVATTKPDEIMLYELWRGTQELFQIDQGSRPYRKAFIQANREFVDAVEIDWSVPVAQWGVAPLEA